MRLWWYYCKLAVLDFTRLWSTTQHHVVIVAGIVLPILLLLGLKRGHVAELRDELLRSPTGRQVTFWSGQRGELLKNDSLNRLESELQGVEIVIPEVDRVCDVRRAINETQQNDLTQLNQPASKTITLFATRPGDPVLKQAGCDLQVSDNNGIVLSRMVVDALGVQAGDGVTVVIQRRGKSGDEKAEITVRVSRILEQPAEATAIGYADFSLLDKFEQWIRGYRVESLNWQASGEAVPPRYSEYLVFTEGASTLTDEDKRTFADRGFDIAAVTDVFEKSLGGLIPAEKASSLKVWKLQTGNSVGEPPVRVNITSTELELFSEADDVIIPWSEPISGPFGNDGKEEKILGISLKKRSWLRNYLTDPKNAFELVVDGSFVLRSGSPEQTLSFPLASGETIVLRRHESPEGLETGEATALSPESILVLDSPPVINIVPCQFLARLHAFNRGEAEYDTGTATFVAVPESSVYGKARLFTNTIDEVPLVVAALMTRKFAVMSESGRISEIHQQDASLNLLVVVVGIGVFLFGILTVFSVLLDSTDRKRGVIGILRVMGVSRGGVFFLVLLRAAAIGILAGALAGLAGWGIEQILGVDFPADSLFFQWKPTISVIIHSADVLLVMAGAIACAAIGAIIPAWKASRLDPFDAIVEGRFS